MRVIFVDNRDSFVYNLVDLTAREAKVQVFRNTTPVGTLRDALEATAAERAAGERPLLILSPGPGHPRQAGPMMENLGHLFGLPGNGRGLWRSCRPGWRNARAH